MEDVGQTRTGIAEVNGARLYYEVAGAGHPLVLIHAGIADSRMWDDQWDVFARHYTVIRYDVRGCGRSVPPPGQFAPQEDLRTLLHFLQIETAFLLGISMGGAIAIEFTLAHPEMVDALVTVGSRAPGARPSDEMIAAWKSVDEVLEAGDIERANELELRMWVDGPYRGPDVVDPAVREGVRVMNGNNFLVGSEESEPQPLEPFAITRLEEIRVPTLVIYGDLDQPDVQQGGEELARRIGGAKKLVMSGAAHMPSMEQPDEFNRVVLEFLAGLA